GGHHMIDEALLGKILLNMSDRILAQQSDFELFAESPRKCRSAELALPIIATRAELSPAIALVVQQPQAARHRALHRMPNVVHIERVAVGPPVKIAQPAEI